MEESVETKQFYEECKTVYKCSKCLVVSLKSILTQTGDGFRVSEAFVGVLDSLSSIVEGMKKIGLYTISHPNREIENQKITLWKTRVFIEKLAISRLTHDLIVQLVDSPATESALRLACLHNDLAAVNLSGDFRNVNVFGNACPMLLHPLKKVSSTRFLQISAAKRAEACSFRLIVQLLNNYFEPEDSSPDLQAIAKDEDVTPKKPQAKSVEANAPTDEAKGQNHRLLVTQTSASSNTSVEIYRALTKDLEGRGRDDEGQSGHSTEGLCKNEEKRVRLLLSLSARVAPQLFGTNLMCSSKTSGRPRLKSTVKNKFESYYQQVLWGEVGGYLEHILLWWNPDPLGSFPPPLCQNLKDYLFELKAADSIPPLLLPSVDSLLDAMCCHLTSVSWDQLFRKTLASGGNIKSDVYRGYGIEGSATGQLFAEMLVDLIKLNNSCETPHESLEDVPLVEQIPILHRLDHSVHMVRLWSSNRCRNLASKWDLDEFYCTCYTDISKCLLALKSLRLTNHGEIPPGTSVQVTVCTKMKAKLVSEIQENVKKLENTTKECIEVLAKNCRTECLAILHMTFPEPTFWRRNGPLPECASDYVEKYLDAVLRPVFAATNKMSTEIQQSSGAMVLRIVCESWLEYVYTHRIKFSEWGAVQLLTDFGAVPTWLVERVHLPKELLASLVSHEVLRRCEGVGRLLLRRRGESISMSPSMYKATGDESSADNMPAEMYVPNQEQWLDLRSSTKTNVCCRL